jgi:hypothetical protein
MSDIISSGLANLHRMSAWDVDELMRIGLLIVDATGAERARRIEMATHEASQRAADNAIDRIATWTPAYDREGDP